MSSLKFLNYFILQWFFIRLAKIIDNKTKKILQYKILFGVVPTTGWENDYKYIGKKGIK